MNIIEDLIEQHLQIGVIDEDKIKDTKEILKVSTKAADNAKDNKSDEKEVVQKNFKEPKQKSNKFLKVGNSGVFTLVIFAILIIALIYTKVTNVKS